MLAIADVTAWTYEETDHHSRPVPQMPKVERDAWVRLSNQPRLSRDEHVLLRALDRKIRFRARFDVSGVWQ
ncbi:MAG: hypothetical protein EKK55_22655 [Rhodocyclaceae bacterium]|nr:MAG: hypothetical protein EKK55_22655 [Rhodocyclaceae bacterium]